MLRNARKQVTLKLNRNQLGVVMDALQNRYDFLKDFGSEAAGEKKAVMRVLNRVAPKFIELGQ
jgi:hypothetical protein